MTGPILLFGSGETSPSGRKSFDLALRQVLEVNPPKEGYRLHLPVIALLETPAGFEINSYQVIRRVADFIETHLENYRPQTTIVRAKKRGTSLSPDSPEIAAGVLPADVIFLGPGSPTYAVRQLKDSLTWKTALYHHQQGAALALASAAAIAISAHSLPVYEIYKVGEELFWNQGLNLFGSAGLELVFVPHWNNNDGGVELDTSRCFMGVERFSLLKGMLPETAVIVGIDENTTLWIDPSATCCRVIGSGAITVVGGDCETRHVEGETFPLADLGPYKNPDPISIEEISALAGYLENAAGEPEQPRKEVLDLVEKRQDARSNKNWDAADRLRNEIADLGWQVEDTAEGPRLLKK